jgi:hypothetical protein
VLPDPDEVGAVPSPTITHVPAAEPSAPAATRRTYPVGADRGSSNVRVKWP